MKVRTLTSTGIAIVGIPLLFLSKYLIYPIVIALLCVASMYEISALTGFRKKPFVWVPTYLIALAMPIGAYFFRDDQFKYLLICAGVLFLYMMYLYAYAVISCGKVKFSDVGMQFTLLAYISVSFTTMALTRYIENGAYMFCLVFAACWICDTFAYFVGRAIGKHKLIEKISPKKTVEGSIGGVVFATLAFLLYGLIVSLIVGSKAEGPKPDYLVLAILGFSLSIVSQFGDLIFSLIKREHGVKDYGFILPGHGGILDRFDSILAVSPVLYIICVFFK